jgi:hypothetical protein
LQPLRAVIDGAVYKYLLLLLMMMLLSISRLSSLLLRRGLH